MQVDVDIFVCYRRDDAADFAKRIYERLNRSFNVFMDTSSLKPGTPWGDRIRKNLAAARVVLVVIGERWLTAGIDRHGRRPIDKETDWVRNEVASALDANKEIIPVLTALAEMPPVDALPEPIRGLPALQYIKIDSRNGDTRDLDPLIEAVETKIRGIVAPDPVRESLAEALAHENIYDLREKVGEGNFVQVYRAHDRVLDRDVAIRVNNTPANEWFVHNLSSAARVAEEIHNFVPIYQANTQHDPPYVVMRFLKDGTLRKVIDHEFDNKGLPFREAHRILLEIGNALVRAHHKDIYHCNIKPSNILVSKKGEIYESYLSPFSQMYSLREQSLLDNVNTGPDSRDRTEDLCYLAPECFDPNYVGDDADEKYRRVDQYMLGLLGYEMITGDIPETVASLDDIIDRGHHAFRSLPPLRELRSGCPDRLANILRRMTHKSPGKRYSSLEAAIHELSQVSFDSLVIAKESYIRCLGRDRIQGETFFQAFYTEFQRSSPEARAIFDRRFKNDPHKWDKQQLVLREALYLLFVYAEEHRYYSRSDRANVLSRIAESHNEKHIGARPPLYDHFVDALIRCVGGNAHLPEPFDTYCKAGERERERIEEAWREVLEPGIRYMKERFWG